MSVSFEFERNQVFTSNYTSEDAIDERIASIEYRMWTHSNSSRLHVKAHADTHGITNTETHVVAQRRQCGE